MSTEIGRRSYLAPRLPQEIMEELDDLKRIEDVLADQREDTASHRFRVKSVKKMRSDLQEELYAAQLLDSNNDFEFSLEGAPVQDHMVTAGFLGKFLADLQILTDHVFLAAGGSSGASDKIPSSSLLESRIMITGWHASSFTVQFRLLPAEQIDDFFVSDRREMALRDLRGLFDDLTPNGELADLITKSASKAAYKRILRNVANQGAIVRLRTRIDPYPTRLSAEVAADRSKWMETAEKETERVLKVAGKLVAGNIDVHTFRIRTKERVYWGPIGQDAQEQIQKIALGSNVNAMISEVSRHKTKADVKPVETHTLQSIFEAPKEKEEETDNLFE